MASVFYLYFSLINAIFVGIMGDDKPRSWTTTMALWMLPALAVLVPTYSGVAFFKLHHTPSIALAGALGATLVTGSMTIGAFCLTDFVQNKQAARVFYIILFAGILYFIHLP